MGLLGNQVAESMTHADARELSSLIINTLGSYELKKEMWGGMNLILYVHPLQTVPFFSPSFSRATL